MKQNEETNRLEEKNHQLQKENERLRKELRKYKESLERLQNDDQRKNTGAEDDKQLHINEARYRYLFESTGTAIIIFDDDKIIRMCNKKFESLMQYPRDKIINRMKWSDLVHADDLERLEQYHRQRSEGTGNPPSEHYVRFVDKYGSIREVQVTISLNAKNKERIASFTDITGIRKMQKA